MKNQQFPLDDEYSIHQGSPCSANLDIIAPGLTRVSAQS